MARHRNFRNRSYSYDYDDDDFYGQSVEEDSCLSPNDSAQFLYDRSRNQQAISNFMDSHANIEEEIEGEPSAGDTSRSSLERRESLDVRSLNLTELDEAKLMSCLDELRNVLDDTVPENILIETALKHNFDCSKALDSILNATKSQEAPKVKDTPKPVIPVNFSKAAVIPILENAPKVVTTNREAKTASAIKGFKVEQKKSPDSLPQTPRDQSREFLLQAFYILLETKILINQTLIKYH